MPMAEVQVQRSRGPDVGTPSLSLPPSSSPLPWEESWENIIFSASCGFEGALLLSQLVWCSAYPAVNALLSRIKTLCTVLQKALKDSCGYCNSIFEADTTNEATSHRCLTIIYLFIYLLTNAYKQLHLTRRKKKKQHALGVTKGGKPPPTRHSRDKINTSLFKSPINMIHEHNDISLNCNLKFVSFDVYL
jgi:hypothetical protein